MVRNYKRKTVTTYTDQDIIRAVRAVRLRNQSIKSAAKEHGVPYGTLQNRLKDRHEKAWGGQTYLPLDFEEHLLEALDRLVEWKVPFDPYDIRCLVKCYHDSAGLTHLKFANNMPGNDWVYSFIRRNNLTKRVADNVRAARAEVTEALINDYFNNAEKWIKDLTPDRIYNYDETNMTDDPGSKTVVCRRGRSRVEIKSNHSKSSVSVMFCGNAAGEYVPPMVVYKAQNLYESWTQGGPNNTVYAVTPSGWFDAATFETWFFKQFLPATQHQRDGPIALIGDNLGAHFSPGVIEECIENKVIFLCLVPNSTHLTQPLDVAVFRPLKIEWRDILDTWRRDSRRKENLPKDAFPTLLNSLMLRLKPENLIAGFRATGIFPLDRNEVLKRMPSADVSLESVDHDVFNEAVMSVLKENCGVGDKSKRKQTKRGPKVFALKVSEKEKNSDFSDIKHSRFSFVSLNKLFLQSA